MFQFSSELEQTWHASSFQSQKCISYQFCLVDPFFGNYQSYIFWVATNLLKYSMYSLKLRNPYKRYLLTSRDPFQGPREQFCGSNYFVFGFGPKKIPQFSSEYFFVKNTRLHCTYSILVKLLYKYGPFIWLNVNSPMSMTRRSQNF